MFSRIHKDHYQSFIDNYTDLDELYGREFIHGDYCLLPRLFHEKYPFAGLELHTESKDKYTRYAFNFTGELRDNQKPVIDAVRDYYNTNKNIFGVLGLICGMGKTYMATYITTQLKYKTCIIVDTLVLGDEWFKSFETTTNIPKSKIGKIGDGKYEIDKPIVITTVQGIVAKMKKDFLQVRKDFHDFGLVIIDEAHASSSSEKFSQALYPFRTDNLLSLTATPNLQGLNKILFESTVGNILYEYKEYEMKPDICFVNFRSNIRHHEGKFHYMPDAIKKLAHYNSVITQSKTYLKVISSLKSYELPEAFKNLSFKDFYKLTQPQNKLGEVENLGDMINYGYGFFNVVNKERTN
jgi:superfamily II DNA or RNA helicase